MERWIGKVAVVTGASSGIGADTVKELINANLKVVGLARRVERIEAIRDTLPEEQKGRLWAIKCDVRQEDSVKKAFQWIEKNLDGTDILINSAGIVRAGCLVDENSTAPAEDTLNTNVLGVMHCTREAFQQMKRRNINGHIIFINSMTGHKIPEFLNSVTMINMYCPSKYTVTAMVEIYRQEFKRLGMNIKVTSISPGAVKTEIFPEEMNDILPYLIYLNPKDVTDAIMFALSVPNHVQIREIILDAIVKDEES